MKKIFLLSNAVFLLLLNGVQAQTQQKELNPVELNNQLVGSWEFEFGSDTTGYADITTYGTGIDFNAKLVSKDKTIIEQRFIWAYDKTLNKMIGLNQIKGGEDAVLLLGQWISKNKYVIVNYKDISNPEEATERTEGILKSNELLEITDYINNKPVNTLTYIRVK